MISPHGSCKFGDTRRCLACLGRGTVSVGTHWLALGLRGVLGLEELSYSSDRPFSGIRAGISQSPSGRPVLPSRGEDSLCQPKLNELIKTPGGALRSPDPLRGFSPLSPSRPFAPRRGYSVCPRRQSSGPPRGNPVERWVWFPGAIRSQGVCPTQAPVITERTTLAVLRAKDRPAVPFGG